MKRLLFIPAILILALGLFITPAQAVTRLKDTSIKSDTILGGEVVISGTVEVASGVRLTILPGTNVLFTHIDKDKDGAGESMLFVLGSLVAEGTPEKAIHFGPDDPTSGNRAYWEGVYFIVSESDENRLVHCNFTQAHRAIHMHFSKLSVKDSTFLRNQRAIQFQESIVDLSGCRFRWNHNALHFRNSTVKIENSLFRQNTIGLNVLRSELSILGSDFMSQAYMTINARESKILIENCRFNRNRRGPLARQSEVKVIGSTFKENFENGLSLRFDSSSLVEKSTFFQNGRHAVSINESDIILQHNNFMRTVRNVLNINGPLPVTAIGNKIQPEISPSEKIYDSTDNPLLGRVYWLP